jgi:hypothetical protein
VRDIGVKEKIKRRSLADWVIGSLVIEIIESVKPINQ